MSLKLNNARKTNVPEARVFWRNVEYLKAVHGITDTAVAKALMRSRSTICKYKVHPEYTSLRDIYNAAYFFGVEPASLLKPMIVDGVDSIFIGGESDESDI